MADTKISALPASTTPLAGTEVLPIVQSGATKQVSVADLTAGRAISATQLTLTTGNLIVSNGKGIDFSATPGTGTSELLADYEEGTWTPSDTSGAGLTLTITGTSTYTKIGRQVIVNADITYPLTANASLTLVGGLPFTTSAAPNGAGSIGYTDYGNWITIGPGGGSTGFRFIGATAFLTNAQLSGKRVQVCIVYTV
jgi:hypothetical protein